jgi:hypothetical protein
VQSAPSTECVSKIVFLGSRGPMPVPSVKKAIWAHSLCLLIYPSLHISWGGHAGAWHALVRERVVRTTARAEQGAAVAGMTVSATRAAVTRAAAARTALARAAPEVGVRGGVKVKGRVWVRVRARVTVRQ